MMRACQLVYLCINPVFHFRPPSGVAGKAVKELSGKVLTTRKPIM